MLVDIYLKTRLLATVLFIFVRVINLLQNHLCFKVTAPATLSVSIFETFDSITVLAATMTSVHHFNFPHPKHLIGKGRSSQASIFSPGDGNGCIFVPRRSYGVFCSEICEFNIPLPDATEGDHNKC